MHLIRWSWIRRAVLLLALTGCAGEPYPGSDRYVDLQILAINDLHGNLEPPVADLGGVAWLAAHLRDAERRSPHTVIVSAGDLIGASPLISSLFHDEPAIKAANLFGLDYNAAGNHEFDEGREELLRMQHGGSRDGGDAAFTGADFRILAANVLVEGTGERLLPPYAIERYDGVPVAFIGLPLEGTPSLVVASGVAGLVFEDEVETINALVAEIKEQGVAAIVVVIHQGGYPAEDNGEDDCDGFQGAILEIVRNSDPAIDLFVTGHTHRHYLCRVDGRPVTSAGSFGRWYTGIDARLDRRTGELAVTAIDNVPVTHDIQPASDVAALVAAYRERVEEISRSVVGSITGDITEEPNEAGETTLGALIADAQLAATRDAGAVVAFMNAGGIRTNLLYAAEGKRDGELTFAEISATQPFGNTLVTMTLTGRQLHTLLEQQWEGQPAPDILMPSAGFSYTWSRSAPVGERVAMSSITIDGVAIEPGREYRVTVNSFLAGGGDDFPVLTEGTERVDGVVDIEALQQYLDEHSPVSPPALGRIRTVP